MRWTVLATGLLLALGGCTTVVDEKRINAVIQSGFHMGQPYVIRIRTLQGPQGTFEQTSVVFRGISAVCRRDSPGDCERAAERIVDGAAFGSVGRDL